VLMESVSYGGLEDRLAHGGARWGAILAIWESRRLQNGQRGGSLLGTAGMR
jgi:hypothetical protein